MLSASCSWRYNTTWSSDVSNIDDYFRVTEGRWFDHPRLRHWQELIEKRHARLRLEVSRQRRLLETSPAVLYVTIELSDQRVLEHEDWSDQLNRGLIKLKVRAVSLENESLRFGLAFHGAFEPAEDRFGEGFFNSVLVDELRRGSLARSLSETLDAIHTSPPHRDGRSYGPCRDLIVGAIQGRAVELTKELDYPQERAAKILSSALASYLDDRFSISDRKLLGFG
jgi:hypothetical protein